MKTFEIGKTYIVYSRGNYAHFRAKCIARTAKRVKFEASEQGARFYLPTFTMSITESEGIFLAADGETEEFAISHTQGRYTRTVVSHASDLADEQL